MKEINRSTCCYRKSQVSLDCRNRIKRNRDDAYTPFSSEVIYDDGSLLSITLTFTANMRTLGSSVNSIML